MIRFSAFLVVVAVGFLVAGVVTSKLLLVYIAIGVSGVALLALGAGAVIKRGELFGKSETAGPAFAQPEPVAVAAPPAYSEPQASPRPAAVPAGSSWPAAAQPGPSRAGYLPADAMAGGASAATAWGSGVSPAGTTSADVQRPPAAFTPRTGADTPATAPGTWFWREEAPPAQPPRETPPPAGAVAADQVASPVRDEPVRDEPVRDEAAEAQSPSEAQPPTKTRPSAEAQPPAEAPRSAQDEQPAEDHTPAADQEQPGDRQQPAGRQQGAEPATAADDKAEPAAGAADLQREVTVVPGVPRYHNARCILIRFMGEKDLDKMTLGAARKAGCTPCRACLPDQPDKQPE